MAQIEFEGKAFEIDEDGFLLKFEDWAPEWVDYVKDSEGIAEITPAHQEILDFLQDYYKKNGIDRSRCGSEPRWESRNAP